MKNMILKYIFAYDLLYLDLLDLWYIEKFTFKFKEIGWFKILILIFV